MDKSVLSVAARKIKPAIAIKPRPLPLSGDLQKFQGLIRTISNIRCKKKKKSVFFFFSVSVSRKVTIHFLFNSWIK